MRSDTELDPMGRANGSATCKGSAVLGTACGHCSRCIQEREHWKFTGQMPGVIRQVPPDWQEKYLEVVDKYADLAERYAALAERYLKAKHDGT